MKFQIKKTGINGEGISYLNRKPVFVPGCFPGEVVEAEITEDCDTYYVGELKRVYRRIPERRKSICPCSRECGGCAYIELEYGKQLEYKKQLLEEALNKYAGIAFPVNDTVPSPQQFGYRNKANTPIAGKDELSSVFYAPGSNHPIFFDHCPIHDETVEEVRSEVLKVLNRHHFPAYSHSSKSGLRHLMVRGFGQECQVVLVTGHDKLGDRLVDELAAIKYVTGLFQGVNTVRKAVQRMPRQLQLLRGSEKLDFEADGLKLSLSPQSFFQLNSPQAVNLYRHVCELAEQGQKVIVDAYCGIGVMAMLLHDKAEEVIGIELVEEAVEDGRQQCQRNGLDNVSYICGDACEQLDRLLKKQKIDTLVVDPPRSGLNDRLVNLLAKGQISNIIYVSCNPATLARNLKPLLEKYDVREVTPFDMFPETPHVETVVLLSRK